MKRRPEKKRNSGAGSHVKSWYVPTGKHLTSFHSRLSLSWQQENISSTAEQRLPKPHLRGRENLGDEAAVGLGSREGGVMISNGRGGIPCSENCQGWGEERDECFTGHEIPNLLGSSLEGCYEYKTDITKVAWKLSSSIYCSLHPDF